MAERERSRGPTAETPDDAAVDVRRLPHLISGARASSGTDRRALAREINQVLTAMRAPGHAEAETKVIVGALDARQLDDLYDDQGRSCRKEAVETLLAGGFPHALNVAPEDLAFARGYVGRPVEAEGDAEAKWKEGLSRNRRNGAAVVGGAQALFALLLMATRGLLGTAETIALGCGLAATGLAIAFALQEPKVDHQSTWGTALGLAAAGQLFTALELGPPALIGAVGTVFGLLMAFASQYQPRADPPKPGDWDYRPPGT